MLKNSKLTWTASKLVKLTDTENITFENAVQRGYVWDLERKSLLIHSMMVGYPIPQFFASNNDGKYDMLDGKQRTNAISGFYRGDYALKIEKEENRIVEYNSLNGGVESFDVNGKYYNELPEELQEELNSYAFDIYYYDEITDDEIAELFFRLNNGKALTQSELTRAKCPCIDKIIELGKHEIFKRSLTEKGIANKTGEVISMQAFAMITEDEPCLDNKVLRPVMEDARIDDELMNEITSVYDYIIEIHDMITDKKIAKRLYTKTHMVSIIPFVERAMLDGMDKEKFKNFIEYFYGSKKSTSISPAYNNACKSGSGHRPAVEKRNNELNKVWNEFFSKYDQKMEEKRLIAEEEARVKAEKDAKKKSAKKAAVKKETTKKGASKTKKVVKEKVEKVVEIPSSEKVVDEYMEAPILPEAMNAPDNSMVMKDYDDLMAMSDDELASLDGYTLEDEEVWE